MCPPGLSLGGVPCVHQAGHTRRPTGHWTFGLRLRQGLAPHPPGLALSPSRAQNVPVTAPRSSETRARIWGRASPPTVPTRTLGSGPFPREPGQGSRPDGCGGRLLPARCRAGEPLKKVQRTAQWKPLTNPGRVSATRSAGTSCPDPAQQVVTTDTQGWGMRRV